MADLTLSLPLNPNSAAVLAATVAPTGGDAAAAGEAFAALLGRQISAATLAGGTGLLPIAELLGELKPEAEADSALPADLAALFADPLALAAIAAPAASSAAAPATPAGAAPGEADGATNVAGAPAAELVPGGAISRRRPVASAGELPDHPATGNPDAGGPAIAAAPLAATAEVTAARRAAAGENLPTAAEGDPSSPLPAAGAAPAPTGAARDTAPSAAIRVAALVGTPAWGAELGQRLVWLATQDRGRAELTLTPPGLGRLEVTVSVQGAEATAHFVSASAPVREALEQALPRLREVLAQAGLSLGQASVNAESARRDAELPAFARGRAGTALAPAAGGGLQALAPLRGGVGLIDTFA